MEHPFPPPFRWEFLTVEEIRALVVAVALPLFAIAGLVLSQRAKPRFVYLLAWVGCAIASVLLWRPLISAFEYSWRHNAVGFWVVTCGLVVSFGVSLVGMVMFDARRRSAGKRAMDLLVVPVLMVLLGTMMIEGFQGVQRRAPNWQRCKNNLKQIGLALHNYHNDYDMFPASSISDPQISWRVHLLPYVDHEQLYRQYDQDVAWDTGSNVAISKQMVWAYGCPARPERMDAQQRYYTDYVMLTGDKVFSQPDKPRRMDAISDGLANTLAVTEASGLNIVWSEPRDADLARRAVGGNLAGDETSDSAGIISSWHQRINGLLADGSVRTFDENIDPKVLKALTTIAGEEPVGGF
jgi:hypothetical protein